MSFSVRCRSFARTCVAVDSNMCEDTEVAPPRVEMAEDMCFLFLTDVHTTHTQIQNQKRKSRHRHRHTHTQSHA